MLYSACWQVILLALPLFVILQLPPNASEASCTGPPLPDVAGQRNPVRHVASVEEARMGRHAPGTYAESDGAYDDCIRSQAGHSAIGASCSRSIWCRRSSSRRGGAPRVRHGRESQAFLPSSNRDQVLPDRTLILPASYMNIDVHPMASQRMMASIGRFDHDVTIEPIMSRGR